MHPVASSSSTLGLGWLHDAAPPGPRVKAGNSAGVAAIMDDMVGVHPHKPDGGPAGEIFIYVALAASLVAWLVFVIRRHGRNPLRWPWREWW
jgi:hypothetical protein